VEYAINIIFTRFCSKFYWLFCHVKIIDFHPCFVKQQPPEVSQFFLSVKAMEVTREQVKFLIETCRRNGMAAKQCHEFITTAWGSESTSLPSVYRLYKEFSEGRTAFLDKERPGRPANKGHVNCIEWLIKENNQMSLRELEEESGLPRSTVHHIIRVQLGL
jgi:hypothetical protein